MIERDGYKMTQREEQMYNAGIARRSFLDWRAAFYAGFACGLAFAFGVALLAWRFHS